MTFIYDIEFLKNVDHTEKWKNFLVSVNLRTVVYPILSTYLGSYLMGERCFQEI